MSSWLPLDIVGLNAITPSNYEIYANRTPTIRSEVFQTAHVKGGAYFLSFLNVTLTEARRTVLLCGLDSSFLQTGRAVFAI